MEKNHSSRSEKEIIILGLSFTYALGVGVFAVIRYLNQEIMMSMLDLVLASFGLYVFVYVWKTRTTHFPAKVMAVISVVGTIATIYLKGAEQVYWAYPSAALIFYLLSTKQATILWSVSAVIILLLLKDLPIIQLATVGMTLLIISFFCHLFSSIMNQQNDRLRDLAHQDVLTLIKNRRAFIHDIALIENITEPNSAILLDLDNFKQVNDYHGHAMGDMVLREVALFVEKLTADQGQLYRIGGDEFAILLQHKTLDIAFQLATDIHQNFLQHEIHQAHKITLSLAVSQKENDESVTDWLKRLDNALFKAKNSGRNQVLKAIRY